MNQTYTADILTPAAARKAAAANHEAWSDPVTMTCSCGCGHTVRRSYRLGAAVNGRRPSWMAPDCARRLTDLTS